MRPQPGLYITILILMFASVTSFAQRPLEEQLPPLGTTLGKDEVDALTLLEFGEFTQTLKHKPEVAKDFWPFVNERVAETEGPENPEEAQEFLRSGFNGFLRSYTLFQLDQNCDASVIRFSKTDVVKFFGSAPSKCDRACDVPPCCGRPSRCRRCK